MFCTQCGQENRNDRKFCEACGAELKDYTKPVENTIMPGEIEENQTNVKKLNKTIKGLNLSSAILFIVSIAAYIVTYFTTDIVKFVLNITALVGIITYFILRTIRLFKVKKLNNINKK